MAMVKVLQSNDLKVGSARIPRINFILIPFIYRKQKMQAFEQENKMSKI